MLIDRIMTVANVLPGWLIDTPAASRSCREKAFTSPILFRRMQVNPYLCLAERGISCYILTI